MRFCLATAAVVLAACPDDGKRPLGASCADDTECQSSLCLESVCLDPAADDDLDTLANRHEARLGTSPSHADSDADGKPDPDELAADLSVIDSDGDDLIDALESAIADADGDCLVDELDPLNDTADPTGCAPSDPGPADCEDHRALGNSSGPSTIDLDGVGSLPPLVVDCNQDSERGGWTPLVEPYLPFTLGAAHEYLLVSGNEWLRTPVTRDGWSWDTGRAVAGAWLWHATEDALIGSFECPGEPVPAGAVGLGCLREASDSVAIDGSAGIDRAAGSAEACRSLAADDAPFMNTCGTVRVYARRVRCVPEPGAITGDGGFADVGPDGACWSSGLDGAELARAEADPAPGEARPPLAVSGSGAWTATIEQRHVTLVAGHAYRIGLWAKGSVAGVETFDLEGGIVDFFSDELPLTTDWRRYERGLVAKGNQIDATVRFTLSGAPGEVVQLAGLTVSDLGSGFCTPTVGATPDGSAFISADPGFDGVLGCWEVHHDPGLAFWATRDDATAPPEGDRRPVLAVELGALSESSSLMLAQALVVRDDRWYRVEGWFASDRAGDSATLGLGVADESHWTFVSSNLPAAGWRKIERDLVIPTGTGGIGRFEAKLGPTSGGIVRLDGIGVRDMGPSPCVAPIAPELLRDGELVGGTACWQVEIRNLEAGGELTRDVGEAAPTTSPPSLRFAGVTGAAELWELALIQRGFALAPGVSHRIRVWARAETPTTFAMNITNYSDFTQYFFQVVEVSTSWSEYAFDFTVEQAQPDAVLELQLGQTTSALWLDGISISAN